MNRWEAIRLVIDKLSGDELLIHANGAISRESFFCRDRRENFYLLGSMGLASSVALGVALSQPQRKVIVLDGDGNILMGLGNLALIGAVKPPNLIHLVLDNQAYGTTGNQPTISPHIPIYQIAQAAGYRESYLIDQGDELQGVFTRSLSHLGPIFIQIKVSQEVSQSCPRIPYTARKIKERFMTVFK
ncbi:MAG: sulfopyruvate decarboxylase subunit beta [Deltaproteobacteria bacterium]|mgnify:CR=1 FL=1|nr:MAG: sulfopyruvate decarboxylase subunit beta [Deltaproteobacteria bacterium]